MWIWRAIRETVIHAKNMRVCMTMAAPLVWKPPNSTTLVFPGCWNNTPGVNTMNRITDINTGPQFNAISISISNQVGMWNYELIVGDVASGCIKYTHHSCMSLCRMLESRLRSWWNIGLNWTKLGGCEVKKRTILCSYSIVS